MSKHLSILTDAGPFNLPLKHTAAFKVKAKVEDIVRFGFWTSETVFVTPSSIKLIGVLEDQPASPPPPSSADQVERELQDRMQYLDDRQLAEAIFVAGPKSVEARVGKQIQQERKAQAEQEQREADAERIAAGDLDGSVIPSRIPR